MPAYLKSYYGAFCGFTVGCHGNEPFPSGRGHRCSPLPTWLESHHSQLTKTCSFSSHTACFYPAFHLNIAENGDDLCRRLRRFFYVTFLPSRCVVTVLRFQPQPLLVSQLGDSARAWSHFSLVKNVVHVRHAQPWRLDPQTAPTSLHSGADDRETKGLLLLVCRGSDPLTWTCKYTTRFAPCGAYVIGERARALSVLHPAATTRSSHVLVFLWDCSAVYERSVTICSDGTARRRARDVSCVCLVTDLSSVHACGGERPSVHRCRFWLSAFRLRQACRWASGWGTLMFCMNTWLRCSRMWFLQKNL